MRIGSHEQPTQISDQLPQLDSTCVEVIESLYLAWLPKQTYPIRSGAHTNTAFGLAFALDFARVRAAQLRLMNS